MLTLRWPSILPAWKSCSPFGRPTRSIGDSAKFNAVCWPQRQPRSAKRFGALRARLRRYERWRPAQRPVGFLAQQGGGGDEHHQVGRAAWAEGMGHRLAADPLHAVHHLLYRISGTVADIE